MISETKISEIVSKIATGYNPDKIILFGSYATGNASENSDLDLLVVKDSELPRPERAFKIRKLLYGAMVPIDLIVYTNEEINQSRNNKYSFIYQVLNSGKILYERFD
ncbi:MAG: nucleotidyltransferase domain-containing protein [Bacteroidales bacterium]|nr:nucleotidyltransferase domain-containing protein [Bacteroidales bacterium]